MEEWTELNRQGHKLQDSAALKVPSYAGSDVHNLQIHVEELGHRYPKHHNDMSHLSPGPRSSCYFHSMATPFCYLPHDITDNYGGLDVHDSPPKAPELNTAPYAAVGSSRAFKK